MKYIQKKQIKIKNLILIFFTILLWFGGIYTLGGIVSIDTNLNNAVQKIREIIIEDVWSNRLFKFNSWQTSTKIYMNKSVLDPERTTANSLDQIDKALGIDRFWEMVFISTGALWSWWWAWWTPDNLWDHTAIQDIILNDNYIVNQLWENWIKIDSPNWDLIISGWNLTIKWFGAWWDMCIFTDLNWTLYNSGCNIIWWDDLWSHVATKNIILGEKRISSDIGLSWWWISFIPWSNDVIFSTLSGKIWECLIVRNNQWRISSTWCNNIWWDNLWNHTASQDIFLNNNRLSNTSWWLDWIKIDDNGYVGIKTDPVGPFSLYVSWYGYVKWNFYATNFNTSWLTNTNTLIVNSLANSGNKCLYVDNNWQVQKALADCNTWWTWDNLWNHQASQNIQLNSNRLSNDWDPEWIKIDDNGNIIFSEDQPTWPWIKSIRIPSRWAFRAWWIDGSQRDSQWLYSIWFGYNSHIASASNYSSILWWSDNIFSNSSYSVIWWGQDNVMNSWSSRWFIWWWLNNSINWNYSFIWWWNLNQVNWNYATIPWWIKGQANQDNTFVRNWNSLATLYSQWTWSFTTRAPGWYYLYTSWTNKWVFIEQNWNVIVSWWSLTIKWFGAWWNICVFTDWNWTLYNSWCNVGWWDNLWNHTATQNLQMNWNWISRDWSSGGIKVDFSNNVILWENTNQSPLTYWNIIWWWNNTYIGWWQFSTILWQSNTISWWSLSWTLQSRNAILWWWANYLYWLYSIIVWWSTNYLNWIWSIIWWWNNNSLTWYYSIIWWWKQNKIWLWWPNNYSNIVWWSWNKIYWNYWWDSFFIWWWENNIIEFWWYRNNILWWKDNTITESTNSSIVGWESNQIYVSAYWFIWWWYQNYIEWQYSYIWWWYQNYINWNYSFAGWNMAKVTASNTFLRNWWTSVFTASVANTFIINAPWWVWIKTASPSQALDVSWSIRSRDLAWAWNRCLYTDSNGKILAKSTDCWTSWSSGDNLWDHKAAQNIQLLWNRLSYDSNNKWIHINSSGYVWIWTDKPESTLEISWSMATKNNWYIWWNLWIKTKYPEEELSVVWNWYITEHWLIWWRLFIWYTYQSIYNSKYSSSFYSREVAGTRKLVVNWSAALNWNVRIWQSSTSCGSANAWEIRYNWWCFMWCNWNTRDQLNPASCNWWICWSYHNQNFYSLSNWNCDVWTVVNFLSLWTSNWEENRTRKCDQGWIQAQCFANKSIDGSCSTNLYQCITWEPNSSTCNWYTWTRLCLWYNWWNSASCSKNLWVLCNAQ